MKNLTEGKEYKLILMFAIPMLIGNVFQQLYNIVDSVVVGRYLGEEALAAVGASFPIIFLLMSLIIGMAIGSTILIAQYYGAKQFKNVRKAVDTLNIVLFVTAIFMGLIGNVFSKEIFEIISLPEAVIPEASKYLQIYFIGLPAFFGFQGISAVLRGVGDSKTPLYFLVLSTIINVVLDIVFIVVLKTGIEGVAYATIISQGGAFVTAVIWVNRTNKLLSYRIVKIKFDKEIFIKSLKIGIPSGVQMLIVSVSMLGIYSIVNTFGTTVVAAYSAALRIDSLAVMPAMIFANALSTFVGQNVGANRFDRVKKGFVVTLIMSLIVSLIITLFIIYFGKNMMMMFIDNDAVVWIGNEYLVIVSSFYFLFSILFTSSAVMRGAGDTLIPMFITFIALIIIRIPAAYYLSIFMGEKGIWWSVPLAWSVGMSLSLIYYFSGNWKTKSAVA